MRKILLYFLLLFLPYVLKSQQTHVYKMFDNENIVADGTIENFWNFVPKNAIRNEDPSHTVTINDAYWKMTWNDSALFVLINVYDNYLCDQWCNGTSEWQSDRVEVFLNVNSNLGQTYGPEEVPNGGFENGYYLYYGFWKENADQLIDSTVLQWPHSYPVHFGYIRDVTNHYTCEMIIPWTSLKDENGIAFVPSTGNTFGLEVMVRDNDNEFDVSSNPVYGDIAWAGCFTSYSNMSCEGTAIISDVADTLLTNKTALAKKVPSGQNILIDGEADEIWENVDYNKIELLDPEQPATLNNAQWKSMWDENNLYFLVEVEDDYLCDEWCNSTSDWQSDRIEIYLDVNTIPGLPTGPNNGDPTGSFRNGYYQYSSVWKQDTLQTSDFEYSYWPHYFHASTGYSRNDNAYTVEFSIPWTSIRNEDSIPFEPNFGKEMGIDVLIVDNDNDYYNSNPARKLAAWAGGFDSYMDMSHEGRLSFDNDYNFTRDTVLCDTSDVYYAKYDIITSNVAQFTWNTDGGAIIEEFKNNCLIKWNSPGIKHIKLITTFDGGTKDSLESNIYVNTKLSVSLGSDLSLCKNNGYIITAETQNGIRPFSYTWNGNEGDSAFAINFNTSEYLDVSVTDAIGCSAADSILVRIPSLELVDEICMVTVDETTQKNKIIWERSNSGIIKEYEILKESTVQGQYSSIGTVSHDNVSEFIDNSSNPAQQAENYKIVTIDTCNNEAGESDVHKTIHLLIGQGLPGTYNLSWTPYEGFGYNTYFIYKGSSASNLVKVDSVSASKTQYTDTASSVSYYQITVVKEQACNPLLLKSTNSGYAQTKSNIENTLNASAQVLTENPDIVVSPNPFNEELKISYTLNNESSVKIEIYNLLGMKVYEYKQDRQNFGNYTITIPGDQFETSGIMHITINNKSYYRKIIKK